MIALENEHLKDTIRPLDEEPNTKKRCGGRGKKPIMTTYLSQRSALSFSLAWWC